MHAQGVALLKAQGDAFGEKLKMADFHVTF